MKPPIGTRLMLSTPAQMKASPAFGGDGAGGDVDGGHRGAAEAVDGGARDGKRQAGEQADQPRDVKALLALGEGAAEDQVLDILRA